MPHPHVVRFADLPPSRWANGLGETVELWRRPATGDLGVRLSIATVGSTAPFSQLPGVGRALMALAAPGLTLEIDGATRALERYEVARFEGEQAVRALGVREPGRDLNLMVARAAGEPRLTALTVAEGCRVAGRTTIAVVLVGGAVRHAGLDLRFGDTVMTEGEPVEFTGRGMLAVARVHRGPAPGSVVAGEAARAARDV